jgi:pimeloyl-ACP methyl ester carboxylesterase
MQARRTTRPVEGHARRMQAVMSNATSARLGEILCPTLIIVGAEDEIVPPDRSRFLAEHIPQAKLHILPDAGHGWTMEFPELAVELLRDFLLA